MSFSTNCPKCGASSGPSVGVCPFCKTVMSSDKKESPTLGQIKKYYSQGKLTYALNMASMALAKKPKLEKNANFLLLFAKILLEAEAPSSRIYDLLMKAQFADGKNQGVLTYIEILQAKRMLSHDQEDPGEMLLKDILRRDPNNSHALFMLGAHLFWVEKKPGEALRHLERCVRSQPYFLRAWGCLGALYSHMGKGTLATRAFTRCAKIESNPEMKKFFLKEAKAAA